MSLPDRIYVPMSTSLIAEMWEWSDPVQVRVELGPGEDYELVVRKYDPDEQTAPTREEEPSRGVTLTEEQAEQVRRALGCVPQSSRAFPTWWTQYGERAVALLRGEE